MFIPIKDISFNNVNTLFVRSLLLILIDKKVIIIILIMKKLLKEMKQTKIS